MEKQSQFQSLSQMTEFIANHYHNRLRAMFPELIALAEKVEKVHEDHGQCPHGLAKKLKEVYKELSLHMAKEETILFPLINDGQAKHIPMPIHVMKNEHDIHEESLKILRTIGHDYSPPEGACGTWRALYLGMKQLEEELAEHINLENNELFARALQE